MPGLGLVADHLLDGARLRGGHDIVIDGLAFLLGVGELYQLLGPGQAAGVGGEDAVGAEFHRFSPGG